MSQKCYSASKHQTFIKDLKFDKLSTLYLHRYLFSSHFIISNFVIVVFSYCFHSSACFHQNSQNLISYFNTLAMGIVNRRKTVYTYILLKKLEHENYRRKNCSCLLGYYMFFPFIVPSMSKSKDIYSDWKPTEDQTPLLSLLSLYYLGLQLPDQKRF